MFEGSGCVGDRWNVGNLTEYNKMKNAISSLITPTELHDKEESIKKGKKINPNFIKKTSWKPLINQTLETKQKKKLFIIIDCSGSMGCAHTTYHPAHLAISFAKACLDSGIFDIEHIICHSS